MTGTASLQLPGAINFPPTLIQQDGACPDQIGVPVTNAGSCPVEIDSVTLTQSSVPPDYSLTGLPACRYCSRPAINLAQETST